MTTQNTISCDQCEALSINGHFCHETGCPNARKTWVEDRGEWVRFAPCFECGCDVEVGECCDCQCPDADDFEDNDDSFDPEECAACDNTQGTCIHAA